MPARTRGRRALRRRPSALSSPPRPSPTRGRKEGKLRHDPEERNRETRDAREKTRGKKDAPMDRAPSPRFPGSLASSSRSRRGPVHLRAVMLITLVTFYPA